MVASKKELLILDTLLKDIRRVKKSSNLNTFFSKRVFKHKKSSKKTRKFDSFFVKFFSIKKKEKKSKKKLRNTRFCLGIKLRKNKLKNKNLNSLRLQKK